MQQLEWLVELAEVLVDVAVDVAGKTELEVWVEIR